MQRARPAAVDYSSSLNLNSSADQLTSYHTSASSDYSPEQRKMAAITAGHMSTMVPSLHQAHEQAQQDLPRPYKCPLCDKAFHRLEHQTRHIRTHTGEKPHACQFPGCAKRFSRSDELTRHSRIHNNPNSRRNAKSHNPTAVMQSYGQDGALPSSLMPPPSSHRHNMSQSAPASHVTSPNVSPPHSYSPYASNPSSVNPSTRNSPHATPIPMNINLLATAASQVESQHLSQPPSASSSFSNHSTSHPSSSQSNHLSQAHQLHHHQHQHQHQHSSYRHHPYSHSPNRFPGLSHYAFSSRNRSRPESPNSSTAPSSPTFSHDSLSPTPDHTPFATPSHSPHLKPLASLNAERVQLPGLRHLTIAQAPALAPMEPSTGSQDGSSPYGSYGRSNAHSGNTARGSTHATRISDIIDQPSRESRKLPVPQAPKIAVQELLNPS